MDDVLDWIGDQLLAAERRPLPRQRASLALASRRRLALAVAVGLLLVLLAAVADAAGIINVSALWQQEPNVPSPYGTAKSIPSDLSGAYAILRRARNSADALTGGVAGGNAAITTPGGNGQHYGASPALSRYLGKIDGTAFWLVPGNRGSCVQTSNYGTVCTSNAHFETQGTSALLAGTAGYPSTVFGAIPDAATVTATTRAGTPAKVQRASNAFLVTGTNLATVTIHQQDGRDDTLDIPQTPAPGTAPSSGSSRPQQGAP
jgi:hypothetical protein